MRPRWKENLKEMTLCLNRESHAKGDSRRPFLICSVEALMQGL